ncbi:PREDICTED: senescence-associated carboxylesterase 101-like isoform X2 [Populus euphratica]|uniref:Senescence-associated carboxylesterase 101-like isoform X2 n=1 Tax=Populus euphratica TaxID=75702 RepID=A0AAJ6UK43_POPEU|nr:PREDICTED: senescence-associated carboxylesterase 101-like isoform X2 [Populus euphratica]
MNEVPSLCLWKEIDIPPAAFLSTPRMSQFPQFISGLDLANLVVSADLLQLSCGAIRDLHAEANPNQQLSVRHKLVRQPNCTTIAFATSPLCTKDHILQGGDLVSSSALKEEGFPLFESLCSEGNPSFSVHRAAINLFKAYFQELSLLRNQIHDSKTGELLLNSQLIVTGHSLGGSIASLFTLWLLDTIKRTSNRIKLPLCITFGSPLLGDQGLQRAISEHSKWNTFFLHVAANKDLVPRIFSTSQPSPRCKPFGTFFFCSELGCNCVDDPEVVSMLLRSTISQVSAEEMGIDDYSGIVKRLKARLILREDSQLGQPVLPPLRLGIILQLKAIGVDITAEQQQQNNSINDLISELESHENRRAQKMKSIDGVEKLNRVKIKMACLEWYKKDCKARGIGYYDSYKNLYFSSDNDVTKHKKLLTNYWRKLVEDAERKPQKEGAYMRETWLYAGTNYRRMVEPLDIAEYYRQKGKRDYQTNGRSKHYILLEQWQKEHAEKLAGAPNDKKKQNVAGNLTEDSCFWMNVEEALIFCKQLKDGSDEEKQSARERLNVFEQYVMDEINNYAVSPEIFLGKSSFMNWWKDFQEIIETSHDSPLSGFMKNCRYCQYEKGQF